MGWSGNRQKRAGTGTGTWTWTGVKKTLGKGEYHFTRSRLFSATGDWHQAKQSDESGCGVLVVVVVCACPRIDGVRNNLLILYGQIMRFLCFIRHSPAIDTPRRPYPSLFLFH